MSLERAILVGAGEGRHIEELGRLASTLGLSVVGSLEQNRRDGSGYLGKGKREELSRLVSETNADCILADDELTTSQARTLERSSAPVVDRTELIIRIFESHAHDASSRLETELAELSYTLPRVKGYNTYFSRLGGGGSTTRGPGEQQIEYDRRTIRRRIGIIQRKLEEEKKAHYTQTSRLRDSGPARVSLVGYTNAGKTTILNSLSGSSKSTKDRLFETLETTSRLVEGESQRPDFVVTDTVGFINKLPTQLVHSFHSTLESAAEADVLVLCADSSSANLEEEIKTIKETLPDVIPAGPDEPGNKKMILCLNKLDLLEDAEELKIKRDYGDSVMISAFEDISPLLEEIYRKISDERFTMDLLIPHEDYRALANLYGQAEILKRKTTEKGTSVRVTMPKELTDKYSDYRVDTG